MLKNISLKYRIAAVILLLEALMMVAVFSLTFSELQKANFNHFQKKSQATLNLVSELSRFALFSAEYDELQPYIERIGEDPQILNVMVVDRHDRIVAASDTAYVGGRKPDFNELNGSFWRLAKVENVSGLLGRVAIEFSHESLSSANRRAVTKGIWIAVVGMIIIAVVGIVTGFLLTRRLAMLNTAARCLAEGDLEVQTGIDGRDEVATLGRSFERMAEKIKSTIYDLREREKELEQTRNELETRVHERTSELAAVNKELEYQALHDDLTGLPNRALLLQQLHYRIMQADVGGGSIGLVMMDLDYFKQVNDTLGHNVGDELLIQIGKRLKSILRQDDIVARLGGDEFSMVLSRATIDEAVDIAKAFLKVLEAPFMIDGHKLSVAASIGIANYPDHAVNADQLIQRADMAMYKAKRGKKGFAVFRQGNDKLHPSNLSLVSDLRQAIERNELVLTYQPKVHLRSGVCTAVEALVRWEKGDKTLLPAKFVPFAEKTGLIYPLTEWVFATCLEQCARWLRDGMSINISVNVSTRNLQDKNFAAKLSDMLQHYNINPRQVILEITETDVMVDPMGALAVLNHLKEIGVNVSVDDFGTGYSSLAHLTKLPVDEIKIDRSFVKHMGEGKNDSFVIIQSIIDLAKNLDVSVTAEGVENMQTLRVLDKLNCDYVQGDFLAEPMKAHQVRQWCAHPNWFHQVYHTRIKKDQRPH